jgi:NADH-quinone oxidoreductase subunit M
MNLSLLLLLPLLTALSLLFTSSARQTRMISLAGSGLQLLLCIYLLVQYLHARQGGDNAPMLFEYNQSWFSSLHINYHVGVDGISIAMIMMTAVVVVAGVLV